MVCVLETQNPTLLMLDLVTFDSTSQGQVAMVIYEWSDVEYLGKVTSTVGDLPVSALFATCLLFTSLKLAENIRLYLRCTEERLL
jgi:hypothetical protein